MIFKLHTLLYRKQTSKALTMKNLIITICLFASTSLIAQHDVIETEIKRLEQAEVKATLDRDTMMLRKIWDKNFVVHNPEGKIILSKTNSVDRPVLQAQRVSFTREVEQITINGDAVISMGKEVVVPAGDNADAGQTIVRRYTNIWMKKDGSWRLIARHANRICQ